MTKPSFNLAILTDHIANIGGAESILFNAVALFPHADLFTTVHKSEIDAKLPPYIARKGFETTFLQHLPWPEKLYKAYLPLMPMAVEGLNLQAYDVLLSSHHSMIKGVIPRPDATHLCYCHSPARYIWDQFWTYASMNRLGPLGSLLVGALSSPLRQWDAVSANRVDRFLANSSFTAKRIQKYYNRQAEVLFPPVDTQKFAHAAGQLVQSDDYYLMAGRLVAYKGFELAIEVFNALKQPLHIIGLGPEYERLKAMAGPTVKLLGRVDDATLTEQFQRCKGFIFPGKEDFGIVMVEAQAAGKPVIALEAGGALDIVVPEQTGILAPEYTLEAFKAAVEAANRCQWDAEAIARHAQQFDTQVFRDRLECLVTQAASSTSQSLRL
ncbi:MAG: glycosyltransferase [Vampirovibrionales bacterium]|nr:glycosyltransferase [Vampirovibrionales bacterium]